MEDLGNALYLDGMPEAWAKRAYPSLFGLSQWYADLLLRIKELETWVSDFQLPAAVWLAGFFNPQSFLTAIMQQVCNMDKLLQPEPCGNWSIILDVASSDPTSVPIFFAVKKQSFHHCIYHFTTNRYCFPFVDGP